MMDTGIRIREHRKKLGWTIQKLATLAEIDNGFLSKLETGKASGSWETYIKLAGALGITVDRLFLNQGNVQPAQIGGRRVPVLDYATVARRFTGVNSSVGDLDMKETVLTDLEYPASSFAIRISDDSMEPKFHNGDVVVINPTVEPRPGDYVVAIIEESEVAFRQYRSAGLNEQGAKVFELHPLNPIHGAIRSDRQRIELAGVWEEHRTFRRR